MMIMYIFAAKKTSWHKRAKPGLNRVNRDMDKKVRGQKVTQNTFDKMGRRLPDALGD